MAGSMQSALCEVSVLNANGTRKGERCVQNFNELTRETFELEAAK
jgi:hypothetical protein